MARRARFPGKLIDPSVREYIVERAREGKRPREIERQLTYLRRLGQNDKEKFRQELAKAGLPQDLSADALHLSIDTVRDICRWVREKTSEDAKRLWRWWEDAGPYTDRVYAVADIAPEPFTVEDAGWVHRFYGLAPDVPARIAAGLLRFVRVWAYLEEDERDRRLGLLGRFLAAEPWRSEEARAEYERLMAGTDHVTLQDGEPVFALSAKAVLSGETTLQAGGTVRRTRRVGTNLAPVVAQRAVKEHKEKRRRKR